MQKLLLILIVVLSLAGCSSMGKPRELDPNYVSYLQTRETVAIINATRNTNIVRMESFDDRPIQIDAKLFEVNLPTESIPMPEQYRDFTAEATVQMWTSLGIAGMGTLGILGQGVVGAYQHSKTMDVMGTIAKTSGGFNLQATDRSSVHLHGGIGDRNWSGDHSTFSETGSPEVIPVYPEVVDPVVVDPVIVNPLVVQPEIVNPVIVEPIVVVP